MAATSDASGRPDAKHMPAAWKDVVGKIADWASPGEQGEAVRIAVISGRANHGKSTVIPAAVRERVAQLDPEALVVHITDSLEAEWQKANRPEASNPPPEAVFSLHHASYERFSQVLEANYKAVEARGPEDPTPETWKQPAGWMKGDILPSRVVFVVDVDPAGSAAFVVFVMAMSTFIVQTQMRHGSTERVAVILISTGGLEFPIRKMVERVLDHTTTDGSSDGSGLARFQLPITMTFTEAVGQVQPVEDNRLVPALSETLRRAAKDSSHLIICFPPWERVYQLQGADVDFASIMVPVELRHGDMFDLPDRGRHRVVLLPHGFKAPFPIGGFEEVHVIPGLWGEHVIIDPRTGQLASTRLRLRRVEVIEQVSWVFKCRPGSARVYMNADIMQIFGRIPAPGDDLLYRRLKFEDQQLCGAIAALSAIHGWGGHQAMDMTGLFIRDQANYMDRLCMVTQMGVMGCQRLAPAPAPGSLTNLLPQEVRDSFFAVLPMAGYDASLALFLALPTQSSAVAAVKMQLGALLILGQGKVFESFDIRATPDGLRQMRAVSRGYTKPMTLTGSAWALLGVWKGAALESGNFRDPTRETVDLLDGRVIINVEASRCMLDLMDALAVQACPQLDETGLPSNLTGETTAFGRDEQTELRWHLLQGFVHQLATIKHTPPAASTHGLPSFQATDFRSRCPLTLPGYVSRPIDWDDIRASESVSPVSAGVYFGLNSPGAGDALGLRNWTWVPFGFVRKWRQLQGRPDMGLLELLMRQSAMCAASRDEL